MKKFNKFMRILLSMAILFALAIPSFAVVASPYNITVTNTNNAVSIDGKTYSAYKLFSVSYNDAKTAYSYTWDNTCLDVSYTVGTTTYTRDTLVTWLSGLSDSGSEIRDFADYVYANYIDGKTLTAAGSATASGETATISVDDPGYYMVYGTGTGVDGDSEIVASVSLTTTDPAVTIQPKLDAPSLNKQILHNESNTWGNVGDNQIGDTVEFRTITTVPDTTNYDEYTYVIHDTMSSGLTFNPNSLSIKIGESSTLASSYYTLNTTPGNGETFTVTVDIMRAITAGVLHNDDQLVTYYTATLNQSALIYDVNPYHNDNEAYLTYSNNPYDNDSKGTTTKDKVYDWTFKMGVNKVDPKGDALTGAEFVLSESNTLTKDAAGNITNAIALINNNNGTYTVAPSDYAGTTTITIQAGSAVIKGLDDATMYYLHETLAPDGYNALPAPQSFTITAGYETAGNALLAGNPTVTVGSNDPSTTLSTNVVNNTGSLLPSTGGMGTTIFYVVGGCLTVGAAILLITRKRMSNEK